MYSALRRFSTSAVFNTSVANHRHQSPPDVTRYSARAIRLDPRYSILKYRVPLHHVYVSATEAGGKLDDGEPDEEIVSCLTT